MQKVSGKIPATRRGGKMNAAAKMAESQVDRNFVVFRAQLPELLKSHPGKFAVLHDEKIIDFFDSFADAARFGYAQFGPENFSVQEVTSKEISLGFHSYALYHACA